MLVSIDTIAGVLLLFVVVRASKMLHMERWFVGGLIFWRPPSSEEVSGLLRLRDGLLSTGAAAANRKKQSAAARKVRATDLRELQQRVFDTLRRNADKTFRPGFDMPSRAPDGKGVTTSATDLRDVYYYNPLALLVSFGIYAALLLAASVVADAVVGLPRFWSVLFAAVILLCIATYYLFGWVKIVQSASAIQLRGSIIAGAVGFVVALVVLLAVPRSYLDFGIDEAIAESSARLEEVAGELGAAATAAAAGGSSDDGTAGAADGLVAGAGDVPAAASDAAAASAAAAAATTEEVAALQALVPVLRSASWMKTVLAMLAGVFSFVLFAPIYRFARHTNFLWQRSRLGVAGSLLWTADVLGPVVLALLLWRPLALDGWLPHAVPLLVASPSGANGADAADGAAVAAAAAAAAAAVGELVWLALAGLWVVLHLALARRSLQQVLNRAPSQEFCDLVFHVLRTDIDSIQKSVKSKALNGPRKRHEPTEEVHAQLSNLIGQRYNEIYSQICLAAVQYLAPVAILGACLILAYHEGPAGSLVADCFRAYVMAPLGFGARVVPQPSKVEVLLESLLSQGDAASAADRQWNSYEGENPIGYAAAGASTQLGAIWELRTKLYQAMAHFLAWWVLLVTGVLTLLCTTYWSVQDRSGRLYDVAARITKSMDALDKGR